MGLDWYDLQTNWVIAKEPEGGGENRAEPTHPILSPWLPDIIAGSQEDMTGQKGMKPQMKRDPRRETKDWGSHCLRERAPENVEIGISLARRRVKRLLHGPGAGCMHAKILGVAVMLV